MALGIFGKYNLPQVLRSLYFYYSSWAVLSVSYREKFCFLTFEIPRRYNIKYYDQYGQFSAYMDSSESPEITPSFSIVV